MAVIIYGVEIRGTGRGKRENGRGLWIGCQRFKEIITEIFNFNTHLDEVQNGQNDDDDKQNTNEQPARSCRCFHLDFIDSHSFLIHSTNFPFCQFSIRFFQAFEMAKRTFLLCVRVWWRYHPAGGGVRLILN